MVRSSFVIPGYTFFYWGFTLPKSDYPYYICQFKLEKEGLVKKISLKIGTKNYPARIRLARITTKKFPNRKVVQIYYEKEYDTLKALRDMFIYSYATTIDKSKPKLKELLELVHVSGTSFKVKPIARQETDFDDVLRFIENKNLFAYVTNTKKGKSPNFFINYSNKWLPVSKLKEYRNRINVIYVLYNSKKKQLYVGKANQFGARVKRGQGRQGLDSDWDKFMFYEIDPKFAVFIEQIEAFTIRVFASLLENSVGSLPLEGSKVKLVNRQLINK